MVLDPATPNLEALRSRLQPEVTADRENNAKIWSSIRNRKTKITVPGIGTFYTDRAPGDEDRLAQAVLAQGNFIKLTNGGQPATTRDERQYNSFEDFCKDAQYCLFGCDGWNKVMSREEEMHIAWAVYNHARYPKEFLLIGRATDRLHSGIMATHGITSEYFTGGLLNPNRWNLLINDVWVLGGIKAGLPFISVTDFMSLSRKASFPRHISSTDPLQDLSAPGAPRTKDDIRNDDSTIAPSSQEVMHFIVTMTATEVMTLKECGYEAVPHPDYGQLLMPKMDEVFVAKRKNYTLVDLRLSNDAMRVTQAIQNLTSEQTLADDLIGFLKPNSMPQQDRVSA